MSKYLVPRLLHRDQIVYGIHASLHTGGTDTGEDARNISTMFGGIEQGVLALANPQFESPLGHIIVERRTRLLYALRQRPPILQQIGDGFTYTTIGFDQPFCCLLFQPALEGGEDRRTLRLVVDQSFLGTEPLVPCRVVMLIDQLQRVHDDPTLGREIVG
jgi:hypothetical protein